VKSNTIIALVAVSVALAIVAAVLMSQPQSPVYVPKAGDFVTYSSSFSNSALDDRVTHTILSVNGTHIYVCVKYETSAWLYYDYYIKPWNSTVFAFDPEHPMEGYDLTCAGKENVTLRWGPVTADRYDGSFGATDVSVWVYEGVWIMSRETFGGTTTTRTLVDTNIAQLKH
jgi:hypothetical protein